LSVRDAVRARFNIQDADDIGRFDVSVRVKWLGMPERATILFDVGALFIQICESMGIRS